MAKLTALQLETLGLIRDGKIRQHNGGHGSWRIYGGSPNAVGRVVALGLAVWGKAVDRDMPITLTDTGNAALAASEGSE